MSKEMELPTPGLELDDLLLGKELGLPLLAKEMMVLRGDGGTPITDRESSCVGVRRTCETFSHSKRAVTDYLREESDRGFAPSRAGKRSAEEESGFRPSALRGGDGKYYARGGRATKGSFSQRDWRGGHGSEQGRQHDMTVRRRFTSSMIRVRRRREEEIGEEEWGRERGRFDFGIEDEEPAFMRDEFASEPPSSRKRKGSKEDGFRKKEKKLKRDKEFDKGGKMSSKGGSLSAIYPGRDREMKELWDTVAGADSKMTKKVLGLWMTITS
ncbi:hypothetical protein Syun_021165 [Stephania yunnanensis]|uniref:Uncharacterized protein n=1 Tax=Stephania yunnanensis TaxID=152371 RepID=A0AAP0NPI8_9MAGN